MATTGPLLLAPALDEKPWGGQALSRFGIALPPGTPIGEAMITAPGARVLNGGNAGVRLGDLVAADPAGTIGERGLRLTHGMPLFPILVKLIDAREDLSIQIHPTDATAPTGSLGKTEAWHVLDADPDAMLFLGLREGVDAAELESVARAGHSTAHLMRRVPAVPGTTVFLPAGTVHALGAGVVIYEIQQPSGITYRLDDWGRVGLDGRPRELHLDEALAVLDPAQRPEPITPVSLDTESGTRSRLVACPFFALDRITLNGGETIELKGEGAPQVVTSLEGSAALTADGKTIEIGAGQTAVMLASSDDAELSAFSPSTFMHGWLDPSV